MGAGGLVGGQEVVVLHQQEHGVPGDDVRAVRLRCWLLQLGGWLVVRQEGVVLLQQEDGVPGQGAYVRERTARSERPCSAAAHVKCFICPIHILSRGACRATLLGQEAKVLRLTACCHSATTNNCPQKK